MFLQKKNKSLILAIMGLILLSSIFMVSANAVTLNVLMEEVPDTKKIRSLVPAFEEAYPDINVEIESIPYASIRSKEVTQFLASTNRYEVVIVDNPWMGQFAEAGFLTSLNEYINDSYNFDDFAEPVKEIGVIDDKVFGIPFYNYAIGLIVREDIFENSELSKAYEEEYGEPFTVPENLEELEKVALFIENNLEGVHGLAMQGKRGYKIFEEGKNYLYAEGATVLNKEGKVVLDSQAAVNGLQTYVDLINNAAQKGATSAGFDAAYRTMARGDAAMMMSYNWMLPRLNDPDNTGDLAGNFSLKQVPGKKSVLGAWHWGIPNNASNKEAAWNFIHYMTKPDIAKQRVINGGSPVRRSVINDSEVIDKGLGESYFTTLEAILKNAQPLARTPKAEEIIQAVGLELNRAAVGNKSPQEALNSAAQEVSKLLSGLKPQEIPGKGKW